jgi:SPP1 gp7 family putative phage head morphogenesis protein
MTVNVGALSAWLVLKPDPEDISRAYTLLSTTELTDALASRMLQADRAGVESAEWQAYIAKARWGEGLPFEEAIDYFRARAFVISGVTKADLLQAVKAELTRHLAEGGTLAQFRDEIDTLFLRHGYAPLQPYRIETIFKTNLQSAYQAGRYRQLTEPAVMAALPFWRYVAVLDGSTRPEHAALHGKIFPAEHEFWKTWYPPNGFNCRCTVVAVSKRQIEANGWTVETKDPTGGLIEPVDPMTGHRMPARPLLPDPGWRHNPAEKIWTPDLSGYDPALAALVQAEIGETLGRLSDAG